MNHPLKFGLIAATTLTLAACSFGNVSTNQPSTSSQPTTSTVTSSGDPKEDLNAITSELDNLDSSADFPAFNQQDLEP